MASKVTAAISTRMLAEKYYVDVVFSCSIITISFNLLLNLSGFVNEWRYSIVGESVPLIVDKQRTGD